jgi:acyl-CoA thioester hydrolase
MAVSLPPRSAFAYWVKVPTRWSDHDQLGHVNNTRFYTFDEDARLAYFGELWKDDPRFWKDYGFILARLECDFIAQLRHPATVEIGFRIAGLGGSSFRTEAVMFDGERVVAVTRGVLVWFDYQAQKPLRIPDAVRAQVRAREAQPPEEA